MSSPTRESKVNELNRQMGFSSDGSQYLTFKLGEEDYGVDILRVQEIKGYAGVTRIPNTPSYINGVLNLRGTIVPIIDLRMKFQMPKTEYTKMTVIIVVEMKGRAMGIIVDAVSDVMDMPTSDIQEAPEFGTTVDLSFISGIGKANDRLVTILNIERILSDNENQKIDALEAEAQNIQHQKDAKKNG